jgi:hypothetical protein
MIPNPGFFFSADMPFSNIDSIGKEVCRRMVLRRSSLASAPSGRRLLLAGTARKPDCDVGGATPKIYDVLAVKAKLLEKNTNFEFGLRSQLCIA